MKISILARRVSGAALAVLALAGPVRAGAAGAAGSYPNRPIGILIPFAPGGALDALARPLGEAYGKRHAQSWIIENLGGAGGTIATRKAASEPPDGYHLLMASSGQVSIAPFVYPDLPYDPNKDLVPIVHLADSTAVLYASALSPYRSVADLIAAAKARPGQISFAQTGNGSVSDLALQLLQHQTGTKFNAIPYKGAGVAIGDVAGGQVPLLFTFVSTAGALVKAGRMRPLAVASEQRLPSLPDVPTFAELGIQGVVAKLWVGLMAPRGTPQPAIDTLARQVNELLALPEVRERLTPQGLEIRGGSPADFQRMIDEDTRRWQALSRSVKLTPQ